jgi:hypothetical protein
MGDGNASTAGDLYWIRSVMVVLFILFVVGGKVVQPDWLKVPVERLKTAQKRLYRNVFCSTRESKAKFKSVLGPGSKVKSIK